MAELYECRCREFEPVVFVLCGSDTLLSRWSYHKLMEDWAIHPASCYTEAITPIDIFLLQENVIIPKEKSLFDDYSPKQQSLFNTEPKHLANLIP